MPVDGKPQSVLQAVARNVLSWRLEAKASIGMEHLFHVGPPLVRGAVGQGFWQGLQQDHQRWVVGSAAMFAMSAAKSAPVYSK